MSNILTEEDDKNSILNSLSKEDLKNFLKSRDMSVADFAAWIDCDEKTVKNKLSGESKLTKKNRDAYLKVMKVKEEEIVSETPPLLTAIKNNCSDEVILRRFKLDNAFDWESFQKENERREEIFKELTDWIDEAPIEMVTRYWNNYDSIYSKIDRKATEFLLDCRKILLNNKEGKDFRHELLSYMRAFPSSVGSTQDLLDTLQCFWNRKDISRKNESDYKRAMRPKAKAMGLKDINDPKLLGNYRAEKKKICERFFSNQDYSDFRAILFYHKANKIEKDGKKYWIPGFITRMDELHWNLLSAYLLVRADDENGEKLALIQEKLDALEKENRN